MKPIERIALEKTKSFFASKGIVLDEENLLSSLNELNPPSKLTNLEEEIADAIRTKAVDDFISARKGYIENCRKQIYVIENEYSRLTVADASEYCDLCYWRELNIRAIERVQSKGIDSHKLIENLCAEKIIDSSLKQHFIDLLNNKRVKSPWNDSDWMLYLIIETLIDHNILTFEKSHIPEYILSSFDFPHRKTDKKILCDNFKRAKKSYKFNDFTTKLAAIYDSLSANN